jgi:hypothetical protein
MGPREALQQIRAVVKMAEATDDVELIRRLLEEIEGIIDLTIGKGTLRQSRLTRSTQ